MSKISQFMKVCTQIHKKKQLNTTKSSGNKHEEKN